MLMDAYEGEGLNCLCISIQKTIKYNSNSKFILKLFVSNIAYVTFGRPNAKRKTKLQKLTKEKVIIAD